MSESENVRLTAGPAHIALSKEAARGGMVLLKNDPDEAGRPLLPLAAGTNIALFGKGTFDYVKGGGGSGDVTVEYIRNLYDGFTSLGDRVAVFEPLADFYRTYVAGQYENGAKPGLMPEPEVPDALLRSAALFADTAVISISRFSGEGWDRKSTLGEPPIMDTYGQEMRKYADRLFPRGDYYLTAEEEAMIAAVKAHFAKVIVVLNVGGVVDSSWFAADDAIGAVLLALQGGMEGGTAAAELLCGLDNPSGKLSDTFADALESYPSTAGFHDSIDYVDYTEDIYVGYRYFETIPGAAEHVNYPFGFGLSYTTFTLEPTEVEEIEEYLQFACDVTNTGEVPGREVVQLYASAPQGLLGKPARVLVGYRKTGVLAPGQTETVKILVSLRALASYDDLGKIRESAWVLEKGEYKFYLGTDVEDAAELSYSFTLPQDVVTEPCEAALMPHGLEKRLLADGTYEYLPVDRSLPQWVENILEPFTPDQYEGIQPKPASAWGVPETPVQPSFDRVLAGEVSAEDFVASLTDEELAVLLGGRPNTGVADTFGFGDLPSRNLPSIMTADGPAGVRIRPDRGVCTTAFPCATLLACTWDEELVCRVGEAGGIELAENGMRVWLTPAVNIHRSPLCGRNFEYYSEDPFLAGTQAAAMVAGIQAHGAAACVKHFACNNKETNRKESDSRVSERAAREIYLKPFEIIVKTAEPKTIMTSYNMINGQRSSESEDLLTQILRGEWGFDGMVMTDWWNGAEQYKEIRAGNDVKMGCGYPDRVLEAKRRGEISREEMEECGLRVVNLLLDQLG